MEASHTLLRAQERSREVVVILLEGCGDLSALPAAIGRARKILETQEAILENHE